MSDYYWDMRSEVWESLKRETYVHKSTGQIVADISYYARAPKQDVRAALYVDKPGSGECSDRDGYTFVDIESAKKFVERKFKEAE